MKRLLLLLLITITCFNLAGGYAIAANTLSKSYEYDIQIAGHSDQSKLKKSTYDLQVLQVNNEESEEEDLVPACPISVLSGGNYQYQPEFGKVNKHFLVHYGAAIKHKQPTIYLLHQNFRL